jgi:hypothetical protein
MIVDHKMEGRRKMYLVKFVSYNEMEWLPASRLTRARQALKCFHDSETGGECGGQPLLLGHLSIPIFQTAHDG